MKSLSHDEASELYRNWVNYFDAPRRKPEVGSRGISVLGALAGPSKAWPNHKCRCLFHFLREVFGQSGFFIIARAVLLLEAMPIRLQRETKAHCMQPKFRDWMCWAASANGYVSK